MMRIWSVTLKNVQRGNQKVNSTDLLGIKMYNATNAFLFCFVNVFPSSKEQYQLMNYVTSETFAVSSCVKQGPTQCWFLLGGKQENGPTAQKHATTATQGRGLGRLSALTNRMKSRLKIRNLTAQDLSP